MVFLAEPEPGPGEAHLFGWYLGFIIAVVVIVVVVALVAPILVLAARIARQAPQINQALQQSYRNTLPLADYDRRLTMLRSFSEVWNADALGLEGSDGISIGVRGWA